MVTESIKLDQIVKSLFEVSNKAMLGVINECFKKDYVPDEVIIERLDPNIIKANIDYEVIQADIVLKINGMKYHIEFQTLNDKTMEIRLFEYGFYLAKQDATVEDGIMTIRIPNQAVIFIEQNSNIRDQRMRIIFPNGEETIYDVETLRFWEYSISELSQKKMYNLLPLVIFNHRKILRKIAANKDMLEEEKKQLLEEINRLSHEIDTHRAECEGEDIHKIALAITNISEYLNSKYIKDEHFGEEVFLMTKTLYDPIVEQRGKMLGEQIGERKKAIEIAIALLDVLDDVTIALKTGLPQEEVAKLRKENQ